MFGEDCGPLGDQGVDEGHAARLGLASHWLIARQRQVVILKTVLCSCASCILSASANSRLART